MKGRDYTVHVYIHVHLQGGGSGVPDPCSGNLPWLVYFSRKASDIARRAASYTSITWRATAGQSKLCCTPSREDWGRLESAVFTFTRLQTMKVLNVLVLSLLLTALAGARKVSQLQRSLSSNLLAGELRSNEKLAGARKMPSTTQNKWTVHSGI